MPTFQFVQARRSGSYWPILRSRIPILEEQRLFCNLEEGEELVLFQGAPPGNKRYFIQEDLRARVSHEHNLSIHPTATIPPAIDLFAEQTKRGFYLLELVRMPFIGFRDCSIPSLTLKTLKYKVGKTHRPPEKKKTSETRRPS